MTYDPDERFVLLETKIAYQERWLEELNQVLIEKSKELDELKRRFRVLEEVGRLDDAERKVPHEPPPHY